MTIAQDIAQCVSLALGVPAILSNQALASAPRPADTYATVLIVESPSASAAPHRVMVQGSGEKTLSDLLLRTVQIDVFGPGAEALAAALPKKILRLEVLDLAATLGINLQGAGSPPLFAPILRDTTHEEHAQVELQVQRRELDTEPREIIDTVQVDITVSGEDETPLETISIVETIPP